MMMTLCRIASAAACFAWLCGAAEHFEVRYFHDEDESALSLRQIEFPSANRGIAIGSLIDQRRERGVVLVSTDTGKNWTTVSVNDIPVSLYCLDDTACWMVAQGGIWFSQEGGRQWRRIKSERGLLRVWFTSRERGFAVGAAKKLIETRDGGKTWKKMPVADKLAARSDRLIFQVVSFVTPKQGMIVGRSEPVVSRQDGPLWMQTDPEFTKERPTLSVAIETRDGGETWNPVESSMFGRVSRVRPSALQKFALALLEFDRYFDYASDVFRIDFTSGESSSVFRIKNFAATDIALARTGLGYVAGFQPPGKIARSPVPGKVQVFRSGSDLKIWTDVAVDYRAVATHVSITVSPANSVWLATDQGMILQLVP
jgi:hypothetical protein